MGKVVDEVLLPPERTKYMQQAKAVLGLKPLPPEREKLAARFMARLASGKGTKGEVAEWLAADSRAEKAAAEAAKSE